MYSFRTALNPFAAATLATATAAALGEPSIASSAMAQPAPPMQAQAPAEPEWTGGSAHRFGLQFTPVSALVRIWALHGTYSAWKYGDVLAGYVYQNELIGDAGRAHGHTLALGYRQFFWHGFNLEVEHWVAYNPIESSSRCRQ